MKILMISAALVCLTSPVNAQVVIFSGDSSSGIGSVGDNEFTWSASSSVINPLQNSIDFGWGEISNPSSNGFNLTITMDFASPWTFNAIQFEALNTQTNDSVFSLQLFDQSLNSINTSSAISSSTNGLLSSPWNYNSDNDSWLYATLGGSLNGHQAAITGQYNNVSQLVITVEDHLGLDYFNLDMSPTVVPIPAAIWLFGSGLLVLAGVSRRKEKL